MAIETGTLRSLLRTTVGEMKHHCSADTLPAFCVELGLPVPEKPGSKRDKLHEAVDRLQDDSLATLAQTLLKLGFLDARTRNQVQDLLWADDTSLKIPKRHRRELARALQDVALFRHWENFAQLIQDTFVLQSPLLALLGNDVGVLEEIHRHFVRFPEDADVEWMFDALNVVNLSDTRFAHFIEGLVSGDVQLDVLAQHAIVNVSNGVLRECGVELRHIGELGGYPVFKLVTCRQVQGRAKNLIFACIRKPDIRIHDLINNDIEIASNHDDVLVYDRPLSADGLRWQDLQEWWAQLHQIDDPDTARRGLFGRLRSSIPISSPPQQLLFWSYFSIYGRSVRNLPALIPEVWLHWDPKTIAARGAKAFLTHRMDFLMLLPGGARVVIEVDGIQHYADTAGRADPRTYSRTVAGDRELRLAGYEVYRFAGVELQDDGAIDLVKEFFADLFKQHRIAP